MVEIRNLSPEEWKERYEWGAELIAIYEKEELFWQRRGRENWLLKGDANTSYFQGIANGRKRKGLIKELDEGDKVLTERLMNLRGILLISVTAGQAEEVQRWDQTSAVGRSDRPAAKALCLAATDLW